jgi:hypothetical protein
MGVAGRSTSKGRVPAWLSAAADIRLVGYDGDGDTNLYFEAPTLGEAAAELYEQPEFWPTKPPADDTGFDLLGDVLADVGAEAEDSPRYDRPLLKQLVRFSHGLADGFDGLYLSGHRYTAERPAVLTADTIAAAERLYAETPAPQRVRVVGRLDMIWQSRQGFLLVLDDGQEVRGVLVEGDLEASKDLFNQRVVVHGRAVYRPSGSLLRLDAELIAPGAAEPSFWSKVPPARGRIDRARLRQPQTPRSGLANVIGRWPGTETDEEIARALEELS